MFEEVDPSTITDTINPPTSSLPKKKLIIKRPTESSPLPNTEDAPSPDNRTPLPSIMYGTGQNAPFTFRLDMNNPLYLIRRFKKGDQVTLTFELAPIWFTKNNQRLEAIRYVDYCEVVTPLICFDTDNVRVQEAIDQCCSTSLYELTLKMMGSEARETLWRLDIFNAETFQFQSAAFIQFLHMFWTAYPMFRVEHTLRPMIADNVERNVNILIVTPEGPWYQNINGVGKPLDVVPAQNTINFDPYGLYINLQKFMTAQIDGTKLSFKEAQDILKEIMMCSMISMLYSSKTRKQNGVIPVELVTPSIVTKNLSEILKEKTKNLVTIKDLAYGKDHGR